MNEVYIKKGGKMMKLKRTNFTGNEGYYEFYETIKEEIKGETYKIEKAPENFEKNFRWRINMEMPDDDLPEDLRDLKIRGLPFFKAVFEALIENRYVFNHFRVGTNYKNEKRIFIGGNDELILKREEK